MTTTKREKPLLFGESYEKVVENAIDANAMAEFDPGWVPGYSERVRAADLMKAEYGSMTYAQREARIRDLGVREVKPLEVELKWVRIADLSGIENDNVRTDMARHLADGYKLATMADLERFGFGKPPLGTIAADGSIRRGDVALAYVDGERARANARRRAQEAAERETNDGTFGASTGVPIDVSATRDRNFTLPAQ